MSKFKVGERIKTIQPPDNCLTLYDKKGVISDYQSSTRCQYFVKFDIGTNWWCEESSLEILETLKSESTMKLTEKFVLQFTKEPNKSFRMAGITNGDDMLTTDGFNIFMTWLLHQKYADDFKKDVVDGLLADQKKENK